jgi:predicted PurR-regulated permease PerM
MPTLVPTRSPFWWVRWVPVALVLAAVLAFLIFAGKSILLPLLASFALAFMLEPLVDWFEGRKWSRAVAVLLAMASASAAVLLVLLFLLPSVWGELQVLVANAPEALRAVGARLQGAVEYGRTHLHPAVVERIQVAVDGIRHDPSRITNTVTTWLTQGLFGLVNVGSTALGLLIVPFFVYYLLLDLEHIRAGIDERVPLRYRPAGAKLLDSIGDVVRGYVRGRVLVSLGMAVVYIIGLALLGVPLATGIGLLAGLIGVIPYLGVIIGLVLAIAFAVLDGSGVGTLAGIGIVFVAAQLAEDYVLTPRLIGDRLDLHPMIVFIALIIAGDLFGLLGLVLAIPVVAVCKVLIRFFDELYLRSEFYEGMDLHHDEPPEVLVREAVDAATARLDDAPEDESAPNLAGD